MVLDTHAWIWFNQGNLRLSEQVVEEIKRLGPDVSLSAASVWELALLIEKGRIESRHGPRQTIERWLEKVPMRVVPLNAEIALLSRTLPFGHEDPADRFIAATAHRLGVPLATSDARLISLPWLKTMA